MIKCQKFVVGIFGEITAETTNNLIYKWQETITQVGPGDKVELLINSPGGDLDAGIGIYEYLKTTQVPFVTRGVGLVGSTAALIFAAGTERVLTEGSFLFLHEGTVEAAGSIKKMKSYTEYNEILHRWYCQQIVARSKTTIDEVFKLSAEESFINAQDCLKLGFADRIDKYSLFKRINKNGKMDFKYVSTT